MRAYWLLLRLYPASFRNEYGAEMAAIFARRLASAGSLPARLALWAEALADTMRSATGAHWDILRADLAYLARSAARAPQFAIGAILIVAVGIAATTAAFSVTDYVLIRPLPFRAPDRLVKVWERPTGYSRMELSPANLRDWKGAARSFESWAAFTSISRNLVGVGEPLRVDGAAVGADLLPTLGVEPMIGRSFTDADARPGAAATVLLSFALWQRTFGADPAIVGRALVLDDEPHTVIGVMPRTFRFPNADVLLWTPLRLDEEAYADRTNTYLQTVARLRPGVSLESARAELLTIAANSRRDHPENDQVSSSVFLLSDDVASQSRGLLLCLSAAAGCLLLVACANLANLLLARALNRRRELAVRTALGAGRERLARQLVTESVGLALVGGAIGFGLAAMSVSTLARLVPSRLPIAATPAVDVRVAAFAFVTAVLTGIAFGLVPVLRIRRGADVDALREGGRSGGGAKERLRAALVVAEVAASVVLLVAAGLLLRSLWSLQRIDPGYRTEDVLAVRTALPWSQYGKTAVREEFYRRVLDDVRRLPGVVDAAYMSYAPMTFLGGVWPVSLDGRPVTAVANEVALLRYATPGLFHTLGVPLLRGRDLSDADTADRPGVAVVSESFVRRFFPDGDPIGRHFTYAFAERQIVGVVGDIRTRSLERPSEPQVYLSHRQVPDGAILTYAPGDLLVRTSGVNPTSLAGPIRAIVHTVDPRQPVSNISTLADVLAGETASRAVQVRVLAAFAAVAFLLATFGIHSVLSFLVAQRTHEIGVRVALGARAADIVRLIAGRTAIFMTAGLVVGTAGALAAGRLLQSLLVGVSASDPGTFAAAIGLCCVMAVAGTASPLVRALRVDPNQALRTE